ncbi:MAG: PLP-dependent aminotransferase family protein [Acidobacteriota bacterium]
MDAPSLINIELVRDGGTPLHQQIAAALRRLIGVGDLPAGQRLPPTRDLARRLGVNRGTVQKAYEELIAAAHARAHVGRGTFVAAPADLRRENATGHLRRTAASEAPGAAAVPTIPRFAFDLTRVEDPTWERLARWGERPGVISFAGGVPDARLLPMRPFKECLDAVIDEEGTALLQYGSSRGYPPFVEFLCRHLGRRGLTVSAERLLVVSGSQQGLDLIARALVAPGDAVVVEDPTYSGALSLFRILGARLLPVPVDADGMVVEQLEELLAREQPRLVYSIPTFHNPTGTTLSGPRRRRLVALCRGAGVPLVEDDSDGELRYDGSDLPHLASLAGSGVLYLGAFSKLFFPGLRLGWVMADPQVISRLEATKRVADLHTPLLLQAAMARFGASETGRRLAENVRERYRRRRDAMLAALAASMPEEVTWSRPAGGLSLTVDLSPRTDAADLLPRAADEGVLFAPGHLFSACGDGRPTLRLAFGNVDEASIEEGVIRLRRALDRERQAGPGELVSGRALAARPPV